MSKRTRVPRRPAASIPEAPTPNERIDTGGQVIWLRVDKLNVDYTYQRPLNLRKVKTIAKELDPDLINVLVVSRRADGTYWIIDGQQRHGALTFKGWGSQKVQCLVFTGMTIAQEASMFHELNEKRTKPKPIDLYRAAIAARDPRALSIEKILQDNGLRFAAGPTFGSVQSVVAVQTIYDNAGRATLEKTFSVALKAWGGSHEGLVGSILTGIGVVLARHGSDVDDARLVRTLSKMDPVSVARVATRERNDRASAFGGSGSTPRVGGIIAGMMIKEYNKRQREDKRIAWDKDATGHSFWKPAS